jgi:hypothetical protein
VGKRVSSLSGGGGSTMCGKVSSLQGAVGSSVWGKITVARLADAR